MARVGRGIVASDSEGGPGRLERIVREAGVVVTDSCGLRRGHRFIVGGVLHVLVPRWLRGAYRDDVIGGQVMRAVLEAHGEGWAVLALARALEAARGEAVVAD